MPAISVLYSDFVKNSMASFETEAPGPEEMTNRWSRIIADELPYFVAVDGQGKILGYAYAMLYRSRPAYQYTVEDSVYVSREAQGRGMGRLLLEAVIKASEATGKRQMIAVIVDHGSEGSMALHKSMGFTEAGLLKAVGKKEGKWLSTCFLQRALGEGDQSLP